MSEIVSTDEQAKAQAALHERIWEDRYLSLDRSLRAVQEERDRLREERDKLKKECALKHDEIERYREEIARCNAEIEQCGMPPLLRLLLPIPQRGDDVVAPPADETVLEEAARITSTDRQQQYGDAFQNHSRTAAMWTAYLSPILQPGKVLTPRQVCQCNVLQKVSRDAHQPKRDNLVDECGWARNAEMVDHG